MAGASLEWDDLDEDAFKALAVKTSSYLVAGDIVVLKGEVGTGKTAFVRAAAHALDVRETVTSPTYQFGRSYEGSVGGGAVRINHLDLYRLEGMDARDALDVDEYLDAGSVTFIEWADPVLGLLQEPSIVEVFYRSPAMRRVRLSGPIVARLWSTTC
ncbi:MAG: tRNA (adenosine(37)-N6)-threonylcarbamoyltransferase complex ATPase subunit type 1 TsaE [Rubrobacter sp.]|nr:tRNA (adenosine(37)-N6)-threonylcarbamoyltransferase complex ATPase subunit type 1 TsaE [Rubrobacter sp.]